MLVAMVCYVMNDTFVKLTADRLPPGQILAVRGAVASALVIAMVRGRIVLRRSAVPPIMGVRCALEVTTALASVVALSLVPLAAVTSLMMTAPLLIAVAAMTLRWEPWQGRRVLAIGIGFVGTLLVVRPSANLESSLAGLVAALLCAASLAGRDLVTRRIPATIPSGTIAVLTTVTVALAGALLGLVERWVWLKPQDVAVLAAAATCAAMGNYALIAACRGVDLSVVTPFRYSIIIWAALLGYAVWGEIPDMQSFSGIAMIMAAGAYAAYAGHAEARRSVE
ncbi:DMT family transporter [Variovorax sp. MHTC-1]|nr:DMT family transporter [Variovorax sp. MHTC-1]